MCERGRLDGPHIPTRGVAAIRRCGAQNFSRLIMENVVPVNTVLRAAAMG
jgi:hypothetical protein